MKYSLDDMYFIDNRFMYQMEELFRYTRPSIEIKMSDHILILSTVKIIPYIIDNITVITVSHYDKINNRYHGDKVFYLR